MATNKLEMGSFFFSEKRCEEVFFFFEKRWEEVLAGLGMLSTWTASTAAVANGRRLCRRKQNQAPSIKQKNGKLCYSGLSRTLLLCVGALDESARPMSRFQRAVIHASTSLLRSSFLRVLSWCMSPVSSHQFVSWPRRLPAHTR